MGIFTHYRGGRAIIDSGSTGCGNQFGLGHIGEKIYKTFTSSKTGYKYIIMF